VGTARCSVATQMPDESRLQAETGPGAVAPDGSPVDVYLRLPPGPTVELLHRAMGRPSNVLELGAGVGRITHDLIARGHRVTAVDQSEEMLAHIRGAETVLANIEGLRLGRTFDAVILGSQLVNTDDDGLRQSFLAACARHLAPDGKVLIERHPPGWAPREGDLGSRGDLRLSLSGVPVEGSLVSATVVYQAEGTRWEHPFTARVLDDAELARELGAVGLSIAGTLDPDGRWIVARA